MFAQLDRTMDALLDRLDALVGRGNYVIGLTADHGVTPIPAQLQSEGLDAGRLDAGAISAVIEEQGNALAGAGKYVARVNTNDIYFAPGMYARLTQSPARNGRGDQGSDGDPGNRPRLPQRRSVRWCILV